MLEWLDNQDAKKGGYKMSLDVREAREMFARAAIGVQSGEPSKQELQIAQSSVLSVVEWLDAGATEEEVANLLQEGLRGYTNGMATGMDELQQETLVAMSQRVVHVVLDAARRHIAERKRPGGRP